MNFVDKLNDYVKENMTRATSELKKTVSKNPDFAGNITPFEMIAALTGTLSNIMSDCLQDKQKEVDLQNELKTNIEEEVRNMFSKIKDGKEDHLAYRRLGLMLINIGVKYYSAEYYEAEFVKELLDKGEFTQDYACEIMNSSLINIDKEDLERILELLPDDDSEEENNNIFEIIDSGKYDVKDIYKKLENKEVSVIEIMQNVSPAAYDRLMKQLGDFNKAHDKNDPFSSLLNLIPKYILNEIANDLKANGVPENVLEVLISTAKSKSNVPCTPEEKENRMKIINNTASINEIVEMVDSYEINLNWVTTYLAEHGRKNDLSKILSNALIKQLS